MLAALKQRLGVDIKGLLRMANQADMPEIVPSRGRRARCVELRDLPGWRFRCMAADPSRIHSLRRSKRGSAERSVSPLRERFVPGDTPKASDDASDEPGSFDRCVGGPA
jgi:hypothetical protein